MKVSFTSVKNDFIDGIMAGVLIAIGGAVFLAVAPLNKIAGAVFFAVALLCICIKGYNLYTGKVGFIPFNHNKQAFSTLFIGLLGNLIATVLLGLAVRYAIVDSGNYATLICNSKLEQETFQTLIRAFFCGILMYLAVSIYKEQKSITGIVFGIPVFILSGFEHSIANMFYFGASGICSFDAFIYLIVVVIGNSIGGMLLPCLMLLKKKEKDGE